MSWLDRLRESLARTRAQLTARLGEIVGAPPAEFFEQLEATLIEGDVGVATTQHILQQLSDRRDARDPAARLAALREILLDVLGAPAPLRLDPPPAAVLMLGVNGAGKTTTIGKLAYHLKTSGRTVLLAAADTFRAAAAVKAGGIDVLIADTAGRLHTKTNLMEELKKINRVLSRELPGSPVERLLVLDAATGQNAIAQARVFTEAVGVTGIVLAKLDGSAKGGAVLAVTAELGLPVKLVGLGEGIGDLQPFDPQQFVDALLPP